MGFYQLVKSLFCRIRCLNGALWVEAGWAVLVTCSQSSSHALEQMHRHTRATFFLSLTAEKKEPPGHPLQRE